MKRAILEQVKHGRLPVLELSMGSPGAKDAVGTLCPFEKLLVVFRANGVCRAFHLLRIRCAKGEEIQHDEPIVSPLGRKPANSSKRGVKLVFVCCAGVEGDPDGKMILLPKCLPGVLKRITVEAIRGKYATISRFFVFHGEIIEQWADKGNELSTKISTRVDKSYKQVMITL